MKLLPSVAALLFTIQVLSASGDLPADVGILAEYIELDERAATKLLRKHGGKTDASELRALLQTKVEAGEAQVIATTYVRTRSGRRAKVESIHEFIYPTEFDPPEIPQELTGPIADGVDLSTHANPTAFEMRPVGVTLEVDPVVGADNQNIHLNIAPERIEFTGFKTYGKDESEVKQPIFYAMKSSTAVSSMSGSYILLGVHTPRSLEKGALTGDPGRRVLLFVRATVVSVPELEEGAVGVGPSE